MRSIAAKASVLAVLCLSLITSAWTSSPVPKVVALVGVLVLVIDHYVSMFRRRGTGLGR